jgi:bifunctional UDP-N-acetylglucosamine pyrophosphorylase/glucosamine-1-phosphate N-acetyltransferase
LPKVLHQIAGRPMIEYSLSAASKATGEKPVLVIGHQANLVKEQVADRAHYVLQEHQLGTGHAVLQAEGLLKDHCQFVLVLSGDMPLITSETLQRLITTQKHHGGPMAMVTIIAKNPRGFGRVVRNTNQHVQAIVEEAVATPEELSITELNAGIYCFSADWLWGALHKIKISPKGEYFLTDLAEIAIKSGLDVETITLDDPAEALGINTQEHLLEAELLIGRQALAYSL